MIFHEHLRAAAGRFCSILRGFPAPQGRMRTAFYKSLRRRGKHIKLEENAPPGCYDIDSKTERHPPSCKTLTINQFIIKFQKRSVSSCYGSHLCGNVLHPRSDLHVPVRRPGLRLPLNLSHSLFFYFFFSSALSGSRRKGRFAFPQIKRPHRFRTPCGRSAYRFIFSCGGPWRRPLARFAKQCSSAGTCWAACPRSW